MKAMIGLVLLPLALAMGFEESWALVDKTGAGASSGVFEAVSDSREVPPEYADLHITASLKTHQPGIYSTEDPHGTRGYQLQVNVDGQALLLNGELQGERSRAKEAGDPEAGAGIRYRFRQVLRLKAGSHRVVVSLPADGIALTREITLQEGQVHRLVLEPVYGRVSEKKRPSSNRATGFQQGISRLVMTLNGRQI